MSWTGGTLHHINSVAATSLINSRVAVKGDRGGGTLVWDHRLDHTVFRSPLLAIVCLISHRVVVAFAIVWCPFVLSSRRALAGPIVCMCLATYIVSSWFQYLGLVLRLLHILPKPHDFSSNFIAQYPPPSPLIFPTILWATGLHSTLDPSPPPLHHHSRASLYVYS